MALPNTYKQVEYIESSGTQYINTGYKPKVSSGFDVKFNHVSHPGSYNTILGTRQSTTANSFWIGTQVSNGNSYGEFTQNVHPLDFSFSSVGTDYTVIFQNTALDKTLKCGSGSQVFNFTQDTLYNLYLFAGNQQDGGLFEPSAIKMYYCRIYENLNLVRNFIPCYRKSDRVVGMYDLVTNTFYTNAGTGEFTYKEAAQYGIIKKIYLPTIIDIPNTYQMVEYIQSSSSGTSEGTNGQRIATGITPTNTSKIEMKISNFTQNGSFAIFGSDQVWGTRGFTMISRGYEFGTNGTFDDGTAATRTICDGGTHVVELSQSGLIVDGSKKLTPATVSFTGVELQLFCMNRNGTMREYAGFRMHYCKIRSNGTLVRNFIPCYRKSDSVIGLYDLVNNQFYTNSGNGSFTKGNDIANVVHNIIWEKQTQPQEITEEYTQHGPNKSYSVYKPGYKIKSVTFDWEGYYGSSSWYITEPGLRSSQSSLEFNCVCSVGGSYGYNYGDGQGRYGGIRFNYSGSWHGMVSLNGSSTTSSQNAGKIIFDSNGMNYSIGKVYGTWLQTGTYTFNATEKQNMETLFGASDVEYMTWCWNTSVDTFNFIKVTVVYESI